MENEIVESAGPGSSEEQKPSSPSRSVLSTPDPGYGSESPMSSSDAFPPPDVSATAKAVPSSKHDRWSIGRMEGLKKDEEDGKQRSQKRHKTFPGRNESQTFPTPQDVRQNSLTYHQSPLVESYDSSTRSRRLPLFSYEKHNLDAYSRSKETNIDEDIDEEELSDDEDNDEAFARIHQRNSSEDSVSSVPSVTYTQSQCAESFSVPASPHERSPAYQERDRDRARSQSPSSALSRATARISLHSDETKRKNVNGANISNLLPVPEVSMARTKSCHSVLEDDNDADDESIVDLIRSRSTDFLADIGRERKYSTIEAGFPAGPVPAAGASLRRSFKASTLGGGGVRGGGGNALGSLFRRFRTAGGSFRSGNKTIKKSASLSVNSGASGNDGSVSTVLLNPFSDKKEKRKKNSALGRQAIFRPETRSLSIPEAVPLPRELNFNGSRRFSDSPAPSLSDVGIKRRQSMASRVSACEGIRLCLVDWEEKLNVIETPADGERRPTQYSDCSWQQVIQLGIAETILLEKMPEKERKLKAAVWEIARNECEYLEGLLVLKDIFKATLEFLQEKDHLLYVNKHLLFANLDEICQVSAGFASSLLSFFVDKTPNEAGNLEDVARTINEITEVLLSSYKAYCMNYKKIKYQELLKWWKQCSGFPIYEQSCMKHSRAKKRAIDDLLITPFSRLTRYIPLLDVVAKYCSEDDEKIVQEAIEGMKQANRSLDDALKSLDAYDVVFELQRNLVWPPLTDVDKTSEIPPVLTEMLSPDHQGCNFFLANGTRNIIQYRPVILREAGGTMTEMYFFLFDDLILLTTFKSYTTGHGRRSSFSGKLPNGVYTVFKQPLPLDRIKIVDVSESQGWEKCFSIVHYSRFVQVLGVHTFQAISELDKNELIEEILKRQEKSRNPSY